jgi:signal peptidase I
MLRVYVIEPFSVPSSAMAPTLQTGDQILVVTSRLVAGPIGRGDIVVFRSATSSRCGAARPGRQDLVKRVIGLPGETISSVGSSIDIDGRTLHESGWYSTGSGQVGSTPIPPTRIPAGHYFVMGDNRTNSCDSRSFGVISGSSVVGKVTAIITRNGHAYLHFL